MWRHPERGLGTRWDTNRLFSHIGRGHRRVQRPSHRHPADPTGLLDVGPKRRLGSKESGVVTRWLQARVRLVGIDLRPGRQRFWSEASSYRYSRRCVRLLAIVVCGRNAPRLRDRATQALVDLRDQPGRISPQAARDQRTRPRLVARRHDDRVRNALRHQTRHTGWERRNAGESAFRVSRDGTLGRPSLVTRREQDHNPRRSELHTGHFRDRRRRYASHALNSRDGTNVLARSRTGRHPGSRSRGLRPVQARCFARASQPCVRASSPGTPRAPGPSRRRRAWGGSGRAPAPLRRRTAWRARRRAT